MITSNDFRDKFITGIYIGYDWTTSMNFAEITVSDNSGLANKYRISRVSEIDIFEDFQCQYISQCTLVNLPEGIYLSLDPYCEGEPSKEDCFYFKGGSIEQST